MSLSEAIKEAYATAPSNIVTLHTLEINHPTFSEPIRVVLNNEALTLGGMDFVPYAFDIKLPDVGTDGVSELTITIDNVSTEITKYLELAVTSPETITVTYRPFLWDLNTGAQPVGATGSQMEPPLVMSARKVDANPFQLSMKATFGDIVNKKFPLDLYTFSKFPGLIR